MITIRFSGRVPSPQEISIGMETDSNAEKIAFVLPKIADGQIATLQMILPDGVPDALEIVQGEVTIPARIMEVQGTARAWVEILADNVMAWHSGLITMGIEALPEISDRTEQQYPTAFQDAIAATLGNKQAAETAAQEAEIAAAIAKSAQGQVTVTINGDGDLIVSYVDTEGETHDVNLGPVSAYSVAVKYGYQGTEEEWEQNVASVGVNAAAAAESAEDAADSAEAAATAKTAAQAAQTAAETAAERDVTAWLDEHAQTAQIAVIDNTLSIEGAAAEAKAAGGELNSLKSALESVSNVQPIPVFTGDYSGTLNVSEYQDLPAGTYHLHIDSITSTDTDANTCLLIFTNADASVIVLQLLLPRGKVIDQEITLSSNIERIIFYASESYPLSVNDTFAFSGVDIGKDYALLSKVNNTANTADKIQEALKGIYYAKARPVTMYLNPQENAQDGKYYPANVIGELYTDTLVTNERSTYSAAPYDITGVSGQIKIVLTAVGEYHSTSGRCCLFVDANGIVVGQSGTEKDIFVYDSANGKYTATLDIPQNASGFLWSLNKGAVFESITANGYEISTTLRQSAEQTEIVEVPLPWSESIRYDRYYQRGYIGQAYQNALATNGNYMYSRTPLNVSDFAGYNVIITLSAVGSNHATAGGGACLFTDAEGIIISQTVAERYLYTLDTQTGKYIADIPIPNGASGFLWAMQRANTIESIEIKGEQNYRGISPRKTAYVSTLGSDDSNVNGTYNKPFATVAKALEAGYRDIRLFGGTYSQIIDLRNVSTDDCDIKISAVEHTNPVVFTPPSNIAKITSATAYSEKVYQATITETILSSCHYIYMDGVADPRTEITIADRHPAQRGNFYRCPDIVRILKANSIAEIEASDDYMWYVDGNTLYFSAPSAPSANNPIVYAHTQAVTLFMTGDIIVLEPADDPARKFSIELNGIETRFMQMNLKCFQTAIARNCRVVASPAWTGVHTNRTQYVELINCESCCSNNDGFGGQNINTTTTNPTAHSSFSRLINCWGHDNYDDGYSEHDRSEAIIIGGLYEWNGKAGITPAYSEVCTCIDVYSRHNYQGFAMIGPASGESGHTNGRNGSTLICYGCVSDANTRGTQKKGFVVGDTGNSAIFVNCVAMNELRGFCALGTVHMKLINCSTVSCDTAKYTEGTPTIEIVNGTPVT